jgi:hypothetical protein
MQAARVIGIQRLMALARLGPGTRRRIAVEENVVDRGAQLPSTGVRSQLAYASA